MMILRQSTAATIVLGPFVDSGDGVTPETGLTISQADVRLSKNGGAFAQKNDSTAAVHMENGYYSVALNTTDTNTVGRLRVAVNESGALPVWADFQVVEEAVWDALFASNANLATHVWAAASRTLTALDEDTTAIDIDTAVQTAAAAALASYDPPTKSELDAAVAPLATGVAVTAVENKVDDVLDRTVPLEVTIGTVQADGGNTDAAFLTDLSETADDHWVGAFCLLTSGSLTGQVRRITGYDGATKTLSVEAFTDVPAGGTTFAIINR